MLFRLCLIAFLVHPIQITILASILNKIEIIPTSGVVLERLPDVIYPNDVWTFVLRYRFHEFLDDLASIDRSIVDLDSRTEIISKIFPDFQIELMLIKKSLRKYLDAADDVLYLLPGIKANVTETDSDGDLTFLTGDFSVGPMDDLHDKMKQVNEGSEGAHFLRDHITILNRMEQQVSNDSHLIKENINGFLNYTSSINFTNLNEKDQITNIQIFSDLANFLQEIELYLTAAKFQLFDYKMSLIKVFEGKLSVKLLKPHLLDEMINELTPNLHFLSFPKQAILQHYSLARTATAISGTSLYCFVTLPLTSKDSKYTAYKPHFHPIFDEKLQMWFKISTEQNIFLVTKDQENYSFMSSDDYSNCIHTEYSYCYGSRTTFKRHLPHCLHDIYNNRTDNCNYLIVEQRLQPYISRIQNSIVFSISNSDALYVDCPDKSQLSRLIVGNNMWNVIPIDGHGLISNFTNCIVFSSESSQKIQPVLLQNYMQFQNSLTVPKLKRKDELMDLLLEDVHRAHEYLKKIMRYSPDGVLLSHLNSAIEEDLLARRNTFICAAVITSSAALVIIITIFSICIYHRRQKNSRSKNTNITYLLGKPFPR